MAADAVALCCRSFTVAAEGQIRLWIGRNLGKAWLELGLADPGTGVVSSRTLRLLGRRAIPGRRSCPVFMPGQSLIGKVATFDSSSLMWPENPGSIQPAATWIRSPSRPSELLPSSLESLEIPAHPDIDAGRLHQPERERVRHDGTRFRCGLDVTVREQHSRNLSFPRDAGQLSALCLTAAANARHPVRCRGRLVCRAGALARSRRSGRSRV